MGKKSDRTVRRRQDAVKRRVDFLSLFLPKTLDIIIESGMFENRQNEGNYSQPAIKRLESFISSENLPDNDKLKIEAAILIDVIVGMLWGEIHAVGEMQQARLKEITLAFVSKYVRTILEEEGVAT